MNAKDKYDKESQLTENVLKIDKISLLKENFELHPENKLIWYNYQPSNRSLCRFREGQDDFHSSFNSPRAELIK